MPSVVSLRDPTPSLHLKSLVYRTLRISRPYSRTPADGASDCTSTDRCRSPTTRAGRRRSRRRCQPSPPPKSRPKTRLSAALAMRRAVQSTRAAAGLGRCRRQEDFGCRFLSEAAEGGREGTGPAYPPPQMAWSVGGQLGEQRRASDPRRSHTSLGSCGAY